MAEKLELYVQSQQWGETSHPTLVISLNTLQLILERENSILAEEDVGRLIHALAAYAEPFSEQAAVEKFLAVPIQDAYEDDEEE